MEQGNRPPERRQLTEALIQEIDKVSDSPQIRAQVIWNVLRREDFSDWDIVCFATEALALLSARYSYLGEAAKAVARLVYSAHYFYPENFNKRVHSDEPLNRGSDRETAVVEDSKGIDAPKSLFEAKRD